MKSQRRHELQHNMLAGQLKATWAWAKKNANYLSWGVLLVAAAAAIGFFLWNSHNRKLADRQNEYSQAVGNPDPEVKLSSLTKLANDEGGDQLITVEATLAVANEWASRIISGQGKASKEDIDKFNENATAYYQRVIDNFQKDFPVMATHAHIGLAKLAENRREFEEAAKQYQQAKASCPQGSSLLGLITESIKNSEMLRKPVQMATTQPTQPVTTAPASGPASKPATTLPATTMPVTAPATKTGK